MLPFCPSFLSLYEKKKNRVDGSGERANGVAFYNRSPDLFRLAPFRKIRHFGPGLVLLAASTIPLMYAVDVDEL